MNGRPQRTTLLFAIVTLAAVALGGIVLMQVVSTALREAGVEPGAASAVVRSVAIALAALDVILLGIAIVAGRAYARSIDAIREVVLARARGDMRPTPVFAVRELASLVSAVERLSAYVSTREARTAHEGAQVAFLLDAITEGILQLDGSGRVVRANPAARRLIGLPPSPVGQPVSASVRNAELRRVLARAVEGSSIPAAEVALDDRRIIVSARPLATGGGTVVALVDLTEVRRLESVRRDFVANVSHELKTPLTSIRGYVETLLGDPEMPAETQRQFLEVVQKNAARLHHIIEDLLDLSRLESGGWRPELHEVNALDVVNDVWSSSTEGSGKHIEFAAPDAIPPVCADPGGLRQVLCNLFDNAVRYTPDGGRIEVRAWSMPANGSTPPDSPAARNGYIAFEVRDTGAGIPSDALPRIFERFYRADPARSRAEGGTGLGLSIVRHLVESMGGDVSAESTLGKGTTIRFRLPAAP